MDQNVTLQKLLEAADLAKMVEELVAPGHLERLSPASLSGIRVTLRALRETMLACHDSVATDLAGRNRVRNEVPQPNLGSVEQAGAILSRVETPAIVRPPTVNEQPRMIKKDLRSTFGQMIERSVS